ncbi:hypothetical protein PHET_00794 [Paragonimus heterotremus]|uniref:Uncharacterized protein n=1 Tax=Paragonimus heterotremus TaxID=100268 RepID=A0A8J4X3F1_9TREM|nr:hypothetical protein PHET_00794 [Paragonimus heterotremus]
MLIFWNLVFVCAVMVLINDAKVKEVSSLPYTEFKRTRLSTHHPFRWINMEPERVIAVLDEVDPDHMDVKFSKRILADFK